MCAKITFRLSVWQKANYLRCLVPDYGFEYRFYIHNMEVSIN